MKYIILIILVLLSNLKILNKNLRKYSFNKLNKVKDIYFKLT